MSFMSILSNITESGQKVEVFLILGPVVVSCRESSRSVQHRGLVSLLGSGLILKTSKNSFGSQRFSSEIKIFHHLWPPNYDVFSPNNLWTERYRLWKTRGGGRLQIRLQSFSCFLVFVQF